MQSCVTGSDLGFYVAGVGFENSDTFDSILTVLRRRDHDRVGLVGWGAETGFEASVLSIPLIGWPITEIRYFGDLDENGLRVPANATVVATGAGLPPVRPVSGLYDACCGEVLRSKASGAFAQDYRPARELA